MGGTKKKKKKVRLSAAQKEKADLDKAATALKHSPEQFRQFVNRFDRWLVENHETGIKIFQTFDTERTGKVTYGQFKSGMRDLKIPSSNAELHLLCKLLDSNDQQMIEYNRMAKGLAFVRDREEKVRVEDIRPALRIQPKLPARCGVCALRGWNGESYTEKYPRFIDLTLRLMTFDSSRYHPGHIQRVVHSHLTVFHLGCIVREETAVATTRVVVYADRSSTMPGAAATLETTSGPGRPLADSLSLEECGHLGGPQNSPTPLTLYYDFVIDVFGCPILMCDHYFGQKNTGSGVAVELRQRSRSRLRQKERAALVESDVTDADPSESPSVNV